MRYTDISRHVSVVLIALLALPVVGRAAELLTDPNNPASWRLETSGSGAAAMRQDQGALRVDISNPGEQNWRVQMYQDRKRARDGTVCTLRFTAKASVGRPIRIVCQTSASPWRPVLTTYPVVELTTEWRPYTVEVTFKDTNNELLRVPMIVLGDAAGTVWLKDVSVTDGVAEPLSQPRVAPVVAPAGAGGNLLSNPMDAASWTFETHDPARATLRSEEGMLRIDVQASSPEPWHVQIYQMPQSLAADKAYFLTISARSTTARKLGFMAQHDSAPFESVVPFTELSIGPKWKQYKLRFAPRGLFPGQTRLPLLQLGSTAGTVFIRAISLTEAGADASK